jgi:hypothetical protein
MEPEDDVLPVKLVGTTNELMFCELNDITVELGYNIIRGTK